MTTSLLAGCIFLAAGFIQGLTGFGSALVAIPLLSLIMDIKIAVPLCILNGLVITVYLVARLRLHLDYHRILPLFIGSVPGAIAGATLLKELDAEIIRVGIGVLLITYASYNLLFHPRPLNPARIWGYIAGFLSGAIGAAFSAGGPPTIVYVTLTDWKKEEIKAVLSGFFALNGLVIAVVHAITGATTSSTMFYFVVTALFVLVGTWAGAAVSGRIRRKTYLRLTNGLLLIMGTMMIMQ